MTRVAVVALSMALFAGAACQGRDDRLLPSNDTRDGDAGAAGAVGTAMCSASEASAEPRCCPAPQRGCANDCRLTRDGGGFDCGDPGPRGAGAGCDPKRDDECTSQHVCVSSVCRKFCHPQDQPACAGSQECREVTAGGGAQAVTFHVCLPQ